MKRFILEACLILFLSVVVGVVFNQVSSAGVPLFRKYVPAPKKQGNPDVYFQHIDAEFMLSLIQGEMAVVLDARERSAYKEGHISGAFSLSLFEFESAFKRMEPQLNSGKTIVTYCINVDCEDSTFLAQKLHEKGYTDILIYKGGIEEWQALGNPIATGDSTGIEPGGGGL